MLARRTVIALAAVVACAVFGLAASASAKPIKLLTLKGEFRLHQRQGAAATKRGVVPPPTPCPQNGLLPQPSVDGLGVIPNCGIPELPVAAGEPYPGQMSYYGGHVQTHPREYLVLWGWGEKGAFGKSKCRSERLNEGSISAVLPCDPDGAGQYMSNFVYNIGGTQWANVQDQYYQTDASQNTFIDESSNLLAGIWVDDKHGGNLSKTSANNAPGLTNTYTLMAMEASRAAKHFGVHGDALKNANFIIAQPKDFSDPQAATTSSTVGYCAFHDYTLYGATGAQNYNPKFGIVQGLSYTNMPYALNAGAGCGENLVTNGKYSKLDAYSIGLGHEVEETVTDPGAEDVAGNIASGGTTYYGGWYDELDGNENGDKCAYVGLSPFAGLAGPNELPIPGAMGVIKGHHSGSYAVQSLWSDASASGAGWCAGIASTDLPGSLAGEPPYN